MCAGVGAGPDVHIIASETKTIFEINVVEEIRKGWKNFLIGIKDIFGNEK